MLKPSRALVQYAFRLTIGLAVVALVLWIVLGDATFQKCIKNPNPESAKDAFENNVPFLHVRGCIGAFVHGNAESIIAVFTVLLGFATLFLWWATRNLVIDAKKTAERQLRAYVHTHCGISSGDWRTGQPFVITVEIHNFGKTPAHNLDFIAASDVVPITTYAFPTAVPDIGSTRSGDLGPGAVTLHPHRPVPLTQQDIQGILGGQMDFVFWTVVNYTDAFGGKRITTTCHHIDIKTLTLDGTLYMAPEGNLST